MKIYISFLAFALMSIHTIAQTNTFPSSGNVGIGTTNPLYKLDINGTTNITGALTGTSAIFSGDVQSQGSGGVGRILLSPGTSTQAGYLQIYKGDGITRLGYIGFNNTNMEYATSGTAIHSFIGAANFNSSVTASSFIQSGGTSVGFARMNSGTSTQAGYLEIYKGDGITRLGYIGFNNTNMEYATSGTAIHSFIGAANFNSSVTASSFIQSGGTSVGFARMSPGTSTQAGFLEIYKGDGITRLGYIGFNNTNMEYATSGTAIHSFIGAANFNSSVTASSFIQSGGTSSQFLKADGSVDAASYLSLTGGTLTGALTGTSAMFSGNVGIGTTNPGPYKLAVEGTIGARKIKVTQVNPWADFVFNDNYKLQPLTEVEQYIKTHKHLPDIPSANEVAENGIDVGDNQALLLQKIEELTLYVIEMKKQNERLENKVAEQNRRIIQLEKRKPNQ